jgi:hypothetical protein
MAATKPLRRDILVSKQSVLVTLRDVGGGHRARARSCHPAHSPSLTEGRHSGARRRSLLRPAMLDLLRKLRCLVCRALYRTDRAAAYPSAALTFVAGLPPGPSVLSGDFKVSLEAEVLFDDVEALALVVNDNSDRAHAGSETCDE